MGSIMAIFGRCRFSRPKSIGKIHFSLLKSIGKIQMRHYAFFESKEISVLCSKEKSHPSSRIIFAARGKRSSSSRARGKSGSRSSCGRLAGKPIPITLKSISRPTSMGRGFFHQRTSARPLRFTFSFPRYMAMTSAPGTTRFRKESFKRRSGRFSCAIFLSSGISIAL